MKKGTGMSLNQSNHLDRFLQTSIPRSRHGAKIYDGLNLGKLGMSHQGREYVSSREDSIIPEDGPMLRTINTS